MIRSLLYSFIGFSFAIGNLGCGSRTKTPFAQNLNSRSWKPHEISPPEREYCNTLFTHTGVTIQVSGQARYQYRETVLDSQNEGLGDVSATANPIRHAQYEVTNGAGTILQCGETDENGNFEFLMPKQERTFTLKIYSRSDNLFNRASVFKAPETNELYSLDYSFLASENKTNISITAEAKKSVLGGAFFILDQIHITFDRLKELLNDAPSGGTPIEDIPKADIYWEVGFNPGFYIGFKGGLSFFSRPQLKIFILGGDNGEVNFSDTDHFDPSIIIHEYFHFLEETLGATDSPGGKHNGNQILDPRLAWSEGVANFFQAVITQLPSVIDTRGNIDGDTGLLVKYGLETDINDLARVPGEGDFREFTISRFLWDIHDEDDREDAPEDAFDQLKNRFGDFWQAITNKTNGIVGFNSPSATFRSMGLFLEAVHLNGGIPDDDPNDADDLFDLTWKLLLDREKFLYPTLDQNNSFRGSYGIPTIFTDGTTENFFLTEPFLPPTPDIFSSTNLIRNINFHSFTLDQTTSISLNVNTTANATGGDLEFYIYNTNYVNFYDFVEKIDSSSTKSLPPGDYLIAVVVKTAFISIDTTPPPADTTPPPPAFVYSFSRVL